MIDTAMSAVINTIDKNSDKLFESNINIIKAITTGICNKLQINFFL